MTTQKIKKCFFCKKELTTQEEKEYGYHYKCYQEEYNNNVNLSIELEKIKEDYHPL